jgi:uncharacterized protein DUF6085
LRKEAVMRTFKSVRGECPMGCGRTLFLGEGGYVTCSYAFCPDPGAATRLLESPARSRRATEGVEAALDRRLLGDSLIAATVGQPIVRRQS